MRINKRAGGIALRPDPRKDTSADRSAKPIRSNLQSKPPVNPNGPTIGVRPGSRLKSQVPKQSSGLTPRTVAELEGDVRPPYPPGYRAPTGFKDTRVRPFQLRRDHTKGSNMGNQHLNQSPERTAQFANLEDEQHHSVAIVTKSPGTHKTTENRGELQGSEDRTSHHERFQIGHGVGMNSFHRMGVLEAKPAHGIMKNRRIYPDYEHVMQLDPRNLVSQRTAGTTGANQMPEVRANHAYAVHKQESPPQSKTNLAMTTEGVSQQQEERGFRIKTKTGANTGANYFHRKVEPGNSLEGFTGQAFSAQNTHEGSVEPRFSSKDPIREESVFEPYRMAHNEFLADLEIYIPQIKHAKLRNSTMSSPEEIASSFFQPTWVRVWKKNKLAGKHLLESQLTGVLIYQLDNSHFKSRRVLISHLSTQDFEDFDKALQQSVQHIFSTDTCTEIFIQFKHILEADKLVLPNELKEATKSAGFRWRMMVNSSDGSRLTVFEAKRNTELYPLPKDTLCHEPIKQSAVSIISNLEVEDGRSLISSERQHRGTIMADSVPFDRIFLTFAALMNYLDKGVQSVAAEHIRSMGRLGELVNIARSHSEFNFSGVDITKLGSNAELTKKQMETFSEEIGQPSVGRGVLSLKDFETHSKVVCAAYKSAMRLQQISDGVVPSMPFRYIRTKFEKRLLLPKTFAPVYIIPTMEDDIKLFLVQFSSERSKRFALADLVAVMEQNMEGDSGTVWFPQFKVDSGLLLDSETVKLLNAVPSPAPQTVASRSLLEVCTSGDKSMLQFREQESDTVIKGEFVAGIISLDLLSIFKIPLFMTLVGKHNFIDL